MEDPGPARRRITAFISSAMQELQPERDAIRSALLELKVDAWVYEIDPSWMRVARMTQKDLLE